MGWYSGKGRGGIYWERGARSGLSPLGLVRRAVEAQPAYFTAALARLAELRDSLVNEIVNRVPLDWMSLPARTFAINLVCHNRNQLMELRK